MKFYIRPCVRYMVYRALLFLFPFTGVIYSHYLLPYFFQVFDQSHLCNACIRYNLIGFSYLLKLICPHISLVIHRYFRLFLLFTFLWNSFIYFFTKLCLLFKKKCYLLNKAFIDIPKQNWMLHFIMLTIYIPK